MERRTDDDEKASGAAKPNQPEYIRLPLPGDRCPRTNLSRGTLNELCIPGPANNHRPPVRSLVLKKRGATRGIRLINWASLCDHLRGLEEEE